MIKKRKKRKEEKREKMKPSSYPAVATGHKRGTPYPPAIRERVMELLREGHSLSEVAERLRISRLTVLRYKKMAQDQNATIPQPKNMGGFRYSKLNRRQIEQLSEYLIQHPKLTLEELREIAIEKGILKSSEPADIPSISTLWYVLNKKAGMHFGRASFRDPKTTSSGSPLAEGGSPIAIEKNKFKVAQKKDKDFSISKLLFMDETNLTLNMQQNYGWAAKGRSRGPILNKPKGKMMTYNMSVIIGINQPTKKTIIYYIIKPPKRQYDPIPKTFQPYEFADPFKKIKTGYMEKQILGGNSRDSNRSGSSSDSGAPLPAQTLKNILKKHGVRHNDAKVSELRDRVYHLQTKGLVGLPRATFAGRENLGGPKKPFRSTIYDVVEFFDAFVDWWVKKKKFSKRQLALKTLILDNASTHAAIRVDDIKHKSIFHRLAKERWGFRNIVYQPPRSPQFQPVETFFAYLKSKLRHYAPPDGLYTEELLYKTIDEIIKNEITGKMIANWASGSGYHPNPKNNNVRGRGRERGRGRGRGSHPRGTANPCSMKEPLLPKSRSILCADKNGTIVKKKLPGQTKWKVLVPDSRHDLKNIQVQKKKKEPPRQTDSHSKRAPPQTRFAGYSKKKNKEKKGLIETNPKALDIKGREESVYEVQGIVDHRGDSRGRPLTYRVRWVGYPPESDTWEPVENLRFAKQAIREYHQRKKRREGGIKR